MQKRTSFETLRFEYETKMNNALHNLYMARTREEVEVANDEVHRVISKYTRNIKTLLEQNALQLVADQAKMQGILNDVLGSYKFVLSYEPQRNTVKWTVETPYKSKYWYISKAGVPVDMENWKNWIYNVLMN